MVRKFPEGFKFGASTSAYQVEGAWNVDGKTNSIWDEFAHNRTYLIRDGSNGDVATNSYYLYKRDVEMLRELGVDFYRFSLSWSRILPTSFPDKINKAGVEYYNNLIDELLKYNIEPVVTIYHWDLPQKLQEMGGWTNPHVVQWYADFARIAFTLFGDRVKYWNTVNEPSQICYFGYETEFLAPGLKILGVSCYLCVKNLLLAHATAYHMYDNEFRPQQNGIIFITISVLDFTPLWEDQEDAANVAHQFESGIFIHPIFSKTGDYPPLVTAKVAAKSAEQGFFRSRLPKLSQEEIEFIRGTSDYFGLNYYVTLLVYRDKFDEKPYESPSVLDDIDIRFYAAPGSSIMNSTLSLPQGFYEILRMIREEFGNPPVFITENGFTSPNTLVDIDRINKLKSYMSAVLDAIDSGSNVVAYTIWSLMDNFEWFNGYLARFGLYQVDYNSPLRTRTPRMSAFFFKDVIRERALDPLWAQYDFSRPMTIDEGH
ncbi:unnamed protein product, partial [Brenthis ino]